jgi:hypothetical protein
MKTYEDFFVELSGAEKIMVNLLRKIILDSVPNLTEKISYGVPYYFQRSRVCFIWPASVKYGPKSGVMLGFCKGNLLSNEQGILESAGRKEVYSVTFHSPGDVKPALIKEILYEAIIVDQETSGNKH